MKIVFHSGKLDLRGTCVSLYDYAYYHEKLLNGKSVILTSNRENHDENVLFKFAKQFEIRFYTTESQIDNLISDCDIFYTIKYGKKEGYVTNKIKSCVHCVFDLSEPHGDIYAAVSETLAKKYNTNIFVPHMIGLKFGLESSNMRKCLNISENDIVFGRHGGEDTFDLEICKSAIKKIVNNYSNIHFIFVNTPKFIDHGNVHHLEKIVDFDEKNRFISSCNAMIHGQSLGETFGISIGEFSVHNKPIIAYGGHVWNDNYKVILGDKGIWYTTEKECYDIISTFNPKDFENKDMNCYREYSPEIVMKKFKQVFMDFH